MSDIKELKLTILLLSKVANSPENSPEEARGRGEDDLVRRVSGTGTEVPLSGVQDTIVSSAEFVPYYSLNVYYSESSIEVAYFDTNYPFSQIFRA